ncbi:MAG: hypothetical protein RL291_587 [Pseudomonadota bacterium]
MHGAPKHPPGFPFFPYLNPDAPKGGRLRLARADGFDSLNPFIVKGASPGELREYVYESLLMRGADEPFTLYGHLAETIEVADDRSAITFNLHPDARFSDSAPLTAEDVLFSMTLLRQKGWPFFRNFYGKIANADIEGPKRIRFSFKEAGDREIPLIIGLMPILPKHKTNADTFDQTTLTPPTGSGPYILSEVDAGRLLLFKRNADWWAKDRPTAKGRFNFDEISIEYIRDQNTLFEAFKAGQVDYRVEDDPNRWINGYTFRAISEGRLLRREIDVRLPAGLTAFVFNTRRAPLDDIRVRQALIQAFDAEFINRTQFAGVYRRTQSVFERSDLSSFGRPADARERALLAPFPDAVTPAVMDGTHKLPETTGVGDARSVLADAVKILQGAGYRLSNGRMLGANDRPLQLEFLALTTAQERLALTYARNLALIGITLRIRQVDKAQYWDRIKNRDFDMVQNTWGASASPGNEQTNRWGSQAADNPGSLNLAGVKSPAVDAMITALLAATAREDFVTAVRALDRVIRSGSYVIPLFHLPRTFVAHSANLDYPKPPQQTPTLGGIDLDGWWSVAKA